MNTRLRFIAFPLLAAVLVACQMGQQPSPVPSVRQIGSDLKCPSSDHAYVDPVGWGFCYPQHWRYDLRAQPSVDARGLSELDVTFNITDVPCVTASAPAGQATPQPVCDPDILCFTPTATPGQPTPQPVCTPQVGLFAYMIVSTYERSGSPNLASWMQDDLKPAPAGATPITWGNAVEAVRLGDGRRIALTPTQVVVLDMRSGAGNLDLEAAMSARLGSWKFYY